MVVVLDRTVAVYWRGRDRLPDAFRPCPMEQMRGRPAVGMGWTFVQWLMEERGPLRLHGGPLFGTLRGLRPTNFVYDWRVRWACLRIGEGHELVTDVYLVGEPDSYSVASQSGQRAQSETKVVRLQ